MLTTLNDRIQFVVVSFVLSIIRSATFQILAGFAIWFGFVAFMFLTDAGLVLAEDMTMLALVAWNIFADVLHLPRAPYFPS